MIPGRRNADVERDGCNMAVSEPQVAPWGGILLTKHSIAGTIMVQPVRFFRVYAPPAGCPTMSMNGGFVSGFTAFGGADCNPGSSS